MKGLVSLGLLPTLYMATSIFALLYSLFEYFVFGTFANEQGEAMPMACTGGRWLTETGESVVCQEAMPGH